MKETKKKFKKKSLESKVDFKFNLVEIIFLTACPFCMWKKLRLKRALLVKAKEKFFFQSDILNYLKNMQLLDLLVYSIMDPNENVILQFLSKPSISLAHRKDIYDKLHSVNDIDAKEVEDLDYAIQCIAQKVEKTPAQKRLLKLTRSEMGAFIRKSKKE